MPVIVTKRKRKTAIVICLKDFNSYEEAAYLMKNPKNVSLLNKSNDLLLDYFCLEKSLKKSHTLTKNR